MECMGVRDLGLPPLQVSPQHLTCSKVSGGTNPALRLQGHLQTSGAPSEGATGKQVGARAATPQRTRNHVLPALRCKKTKGTPISQALCLMRAETRQGS